ncbi:hypothetical protein COU78_01205 [Candidatus Peregrinibacteria bacterium CG10_big_fil_rev_8_21_14_0_10_49_24]|nr:MAG: hypothetical protein COV83_04170 [Candidatus Peregrinibacteria bacterium CG11_big_fil_rev_8_21_14_0_20_49_14]PIR51344.1 MAG: hypothetical protein COU78_01205 [Candidatus Peregrinibacteria bacterium CG10_big_fil_rev_8_21_14_0_10_49_24]PJA68108.1 MAG: hypothetical protein CO157_01020 [Candidatus Peregrinibacteria bacterium CG_4_9_14_3_um_filter_49_12]
MNKKLLIIIGIIVAVAVTGIAISQPKGTDNPDMYVGKSAEECSRIQVMCIEGFERFDDENGCGCQPIALHDNWKTYDSDTVGFSMQYDPKLTVNEDSEEEVRFYLHGPTQRGQTEMYDGLLLSVRKVQATEGMQSYIDSQLEQYKDIGTVTEPLHDGMMNGIATKEFSASALGDSKRIFIELNENSLLEIAYMAPDPTNAGFQETIDSMLSSLRIHW